MADDSDYAALFADNPTDQQQALVAALRGQQLNARQNAIATGQYAQVPQQQEAQAAQGFQELGQQAGRRIQEAGALRQTKALEAEIANRNLERQMEQDRLDEEKREHAIHNAQEAQSLGLRGAEYETAKQNTLDSKVHEMAKELEPINAVDSALSRAEAELRKYPVGSAPGVGTVAGSKFNPDFWKSDAGLKLGHLIDTVGIQADRAISGGTGFGRSPEMTDKLQAATGLTKGQNERSIRIGLQQMRQTVDAARRSVVYPDEVRRAYQERFQAPRATPRMPPGAVKALKDPTTGTIHFLDAKGAEVKSGG